MNVIIVTGESGAPPIYFQPVDANSFAISGQGASSTLEVQYPTQFDIGVVLTLSPSLSGYTDPGTGYFYPPGTLLELLPAAANFPRPGACNATVVMDFGGGNVRKSEQFQLLVGRDSAPRVNVSPAPTPGSFPIVTSLPSAGIDGEGIWLNTLGVYALYVYNGTTQAWQAV